MSPELTSLVTLLFSGALVLASFLTFFAICVQAYIYNSQLREMRKASDAATNAAKGTTESIRLTEKNARLDLRAWVATVSARSPPPSSKEKLVIQVLIKNTGKTFARDVTISQCMQLVPNENEPKFEREEGMNVVKGMLLMPNGDYTMTLDVKDQWSEEWIDSFKSGKWGICVFGIITYYDIFGIDHWTKFCYMLDPRNWLWSIHHIGNDADTNSCL
jgi:hypothetical protein